jgi:hypothetical protein
MHIEQPRKIPTAASRAVDDIDQPLMRLQLFNPVRQK